MEYLKYSIEDSTIVELLGVQNFSNDEAAVLELVKNAYDAGASVVKLEFVDKRWYGFRGYKETLDAYWEKQ